MLALRVALFLCPLALLLASGDARGADTAEQACGADRSTAESRWMLNLRFDNDVFGGRRQDQNYTGGTVLTAQSPNLDSFDDPCLPAPLRWVNRALTGLQPGGAEQRNVVYGLRQLIFTPGDRTRTDPIADDRPYAGMLLLSVGFHGRNGAALAATHLRLGIVGPAAQAERVQNFYHDALGLQRFQGWSNQLHNEPVVQLVHERMHRWSSEQPERGWGTDLIGHWGASLGNLATYVNAGAEWRLGWRIPDDFGSTPVRPAGENSAPIVAGSRSDATAHFFLTVDARGVLHDISLDGNSFGSSQRVDRRPWVADVGLGIALMRGHWKLALARYYRTREFVTQKDLPAFGSITISRRF